MKRTFAVVLLLAALGVLCKLALKPHGSGTQPPPGRPSLSDEPGAVPAAELRRELEQRYANRPGPERELVARVAERFRQTAVAIDRTDGLAGLKLLDQLDLEAVFMYEKYPRQFHRLRQVLSDDAAADLLLHWREYFGLKRSDDTDRDILVDELARLSPLQRKLASRYPGALPLLLADPSGVTGLLEGLKDDPKETADALLILSMISLDKGASDLRVGLRAFENHRALAFEAFRGQGLEGFALVCLYGPVLEAVGPALPLDQCLIVLRVNADYVDEYLQTHQPETLAGHLAHLASRGLVQAVGGGSQALRLAIEFGEPGERALALAGPDAADVVFGDFADPTLRHQAAAALGEHGSMALYILDKYAADADFREILRKHGGAIIPAIAQADSSPEALVALQARSQRSVGESLAKLALLAAGENGQAVIRTIRRDGLERAADLNQSELRFYQFLPLYDVAHLGKVLTRGHAPTSGEMTWAVVDGCFVIADVLSLAAVQPEGAAVAEVVRSEVKAAARAGARSAGRELAGAAGEALGKDVGGGRAARAVAGAGTVAAADLAAQRKARWSAVRSAGGLFSLFERLPEALPRMSLDQVVALARPLCTRAGIRLSSWRPVQLLRAGMAVPFQIPADRGLKYVAAQLVQASVGVVGFQKMEEHLAARGRSAPDGTEPRPHISPAARPGNERWAGTRRSKAASIELGRDALKE